MRLSLLVLLAISSCVVQQNDDLPEPPPAAPSPCADTSELTPGERGLFSFAYDWGYGCIFGCSADHPIVERSFVEVVLYYPDDYELPPIVVTSDAPEVADVVDTGHFDVTTHAPGAVRIEVRHAESGELLDALALVVKPVSDIAPSLASADATDGIVIDVGEIVALEVELRDELGCRMVGIGGVDYELAGGISQADITVTTPLQELVLGSLAPGNVTEHVALEGLAEGAGALAIVAPSGARADVPIAVVAE